MQLCLLGHFAVDYKYMNLNHIELYWFLIGQRPLHDMKCHLSSLLKRLWCVVHSLLLSKMHLRVFWLRMKPTWKKPTYMVRLISECAKKKKKPFMFVFMLIFVSRALFILIWFVPIVILIFIHFFLLAYYVAICIWEFRWLSFHLCCVSSSLDCLPRMFSCANDTNKYEFIRFGFFIFYHMNAHFCSSVRKGNTGERSNKPLIQVRSVTEREGLRGLLYQALSWRVALSNVLITCLSGEGAHKESVYWAPKLLSPALPTGPGNLIGLSWIVLFWARGSSV